MVRRDHRPRDPDDPTREEVVGKLRRARELIRRTRYADQEYCTRWAAAVAPDLELLAARVDDSYISDRHVSGETAHELMCIIGFLLEELERNQREPLRG